MFLQDPLSLLAVHHADHRDLVADGQYARRRRAYRAQQLRRLSRRAYYRALRRVRTVRSALPALGRAIP